jgi:glycerol kinase
VKFEIFGLVREEAVQISRAGLWLGAPHRDAYARGAIVGLTRGTTAAHIARAALEGIAYQVSDILSAMQDDSGIQLAELRVDGGACKNNLLMLRALNSPVGSTRRSPGSRRSLSPSDFRVTEDQAL